MLLYLLLSFALADEIITKEYILQNYDKCINCNTKNSTVEVLGFVTYWNQIGYQTGVQYGIKFDYISPSSYSVGLQTARDEPYYDIKATASVEDEFIKEVAGLYNIKIVPRVLFTKGDKESYKRFLDSEESMYEFADTLHSFLVSTNYYGVVFEIFPFFDLFRGDPDYYDMRQKQLEFVDKVAEYLNTRGYKLFLVIPGYYPGGVQFTNKEFEYLSQNVYRFITINYDYSWGSPGPNNPLNWIEDTVIYYLQDFLDENGNPIGNYYEYAKKLMIGVSFYGFQYKQTATGWSQAAILGNDFMSILANNNPEMIWNERTAELEMRFTIDGKQSVVIYPTDLSIQMRVDLAERLGVGISIWELGQGLPYLYQAL